MNDKIRFIGPLSQVSSFIPHRGNYLYVLKLEGIRGYLKVGKSIYAYERINYDHKKWLPRKLRANITDVLIAGPYEKKSLN
ncbi:MAG: hypothetical protein Q8Q89_00920 [bacterium]|nr:hypothetical protein [bacterium]